MEPILQPDERIDEINENLRLIQKKNGLTFGTDSYLLSAFVKKQSKTTAADLGSGTGVASLLCASRNKFEKIYAVEIQKEFSLLAERNITLNHLDGKVISVNHDIRNIGNTISAASLGAVISNPPYMPSGSGMEPSHGMMTTARREENGTIYDFCAAASLLLKNGGVFYTVYRPDRYAELIHALKENRLEPKRTVLVYPDIKTPPCLILTESKKCAAPSVRVSRPLIIYNDHENKSERQYTDDMNRVYDEFTLDFLF